MKHKYLIILIAYLFLPFSSFAQVTVLSGTGDGGFETGNSFALNGWTVVNGTQTNQWFCGNGITGFTGTRFAYVGTASTNNNYTANAASIVHLYRDITFPAGLSTIKLYFRWRCKGRSNEDILQFYLEPTSTTPVAGSLTFSNQIGDDLRGETSMINDSIDIPCTAAGTTQRLILSWINDGALGNNPAISIDNIRIVASTNFNCNAAMGLGVFPVASLPYNSGPGTTCNNDDDLTDGNTPICGNPDYTSDEDVVWVFTPTSTGSVSIDLNAPAAVSTGLTLFDGCPLGNCTGTGGTCITFVQDPSGSKSLCANVIAGHTYYLVLDGDGVCNNYVNLYISGVNSALIGSTCASPVNIPSLPVYYPNENTACMGNDYTSATAGSCGSIYSSGEDKVYKYTSTGNECISISLSNVSSTLMGYQVYYGCPGAGGVCIASNGGGSLIVGSVTLSVAGIYYIVIDSWAPPSAVGYDLSIASFGAGASNDLPCNAQLLQTGIYALGNNNCSSGAGEASAPTCWTDPGTLNTVWYKAIVQSNGIMFIETQLLTLSNTQIEVFEGSCGSLSPIIGGCNDNGSAGCSGLLASSSITLTGLTPGSTIYIRVDGAGDLTGTFNIIASDAALTGGFNQQDCLGGINVCQSIITQPTSFFGCGMISEIPVGGTIGNPSANVNSANSGCLLANELNIVWYIINIASPGLLKWTHTHPAGFYDWIMYDLTGHSCNDIPNNTLPPVRCNWNGAASTMCGMQNPIPGGASPFNFEAPLPVVAGQTIALALSNYSYSNGGYTLDFSGSTCALGNSSTLAWNGNLNTAWSNSTNWSGCNSLSCGVDANIFPAANEPVISTNVSVKNMNILAGSSLTIQPGVTVSVCGDFNNYGTLFADPTSTIVFNNGSTIQHFDGSFTGPNKLGNVVVTKTGGEVITNSDLQIDGNFTTSNPTSTFNSNGKYISLTGNFTNANGNTTYTNSAPTGTLEFNGVITQTYNAGGVLELNNVVLNNIIAGVNLPASNLIVGPIGHLSLNNGYIYTNANKVSILNPDPLAIIGGNSTSYIEGNLQRSLDGNINTYSFPIGHPTMKYQLAEIEFISPTLINDITASFNTYATVPNGPISSDCFSLNYNLFPMLDNGYWNFVPSANNTSGNFNMHLYPTNYSSAANYTTVLKSLTSPLLSTSLALDGACALTSNASHTLRTNMNGFGFFAVGQGNSSVILPVTLVSFKGKYRDNFNLITWQTASEKNCDYFILERSTNQLNWQSITQIKGAGNSNLVKDYNFNDYQRESGTNYYRLKQIDFDGTLNLSEPIFVTGKNETDNISYFPNPTSDYINIEGVSSNSDIINLNIIDVTGKILVSNEKITIKNNSIIVDLKSLVAGTYFIKLNDNESDFSKVIKVFKK